MCFIKAKDKSKHLPKDQVQCRRLRKLCTDDEFQLLLESVNHNQYKCKCEY